MKELIAFMVVLILMSGLGWCAGREDLRTAQCHEKQGVWLDHQCVQFTVKEIK